MLIQVKFEGSSVLYTYHCADDTDVRVGDKVDVGSKRKPTVVDVGGKNDYVKDIVRVLPRAKWKTTYSGPSGLSFTHEWETDKDARQYLMQALSAPHTIQSLKLERCGDR